MRVMRSAGSPSSSPPSCAAISPSENSLTSSQPTPSRGNRTSLAGVQGLDDLVGDVGARAGEHGLLQDQVVLLALEDLLDDLVGAFDDGSQLFVLALVQVFLEFAALALDLAVLVDELPLAAVALGFGEGRCV